MMAAAGVTTPLEGIIFGAVVWMKVVLRWSRVSLPASMTMGLGGVVS
jgi:hypothetical protein